MWGHLGLFASLPLDRFRNIVWAELGVEVCGGFLGTKITSLGNIFNSLGESLTQEYLSNQND